MVEIRRISAEETLLIRQEVLWPSKSIDYVRLENDSEGKHYGLFLGEQLITVLSVFINNDQAQFRKFACLRDYRGNGYGRLLFDFMLNDLAEEKIVRIWCNARIEANNFYKHYGFKVVDGKNFNKGEVTYTIMEKLY